MKVFIETYGCTFNQADSEIMAGILNANSIDIVDNQEEADAIIVNTCYVKLPTESKVINRIKRLQDEFPDKEIIVAGGKFPGNLAFQMSLRFVFLKYVKIHMFMLSKSVKVA